MCIKRRCNFCLVLGKMDFVRGGPCSRPDQFVWNLWWTKWHWDRFSLSISFHRVPPCSCITWGWTIDLLVAAVQRRSLPVDVNNNKMCAGPWVRNPRKAWMFVLVYSSSFTCHPIGPV
jgi:hypothetical protein